MHLEYGPMHLEYGHLEYAQEVSGCTGSRTAYRSMVNCIYTAHIHILTAFFTNRIHKENKQVLPYQPTSLKTLTNIIYCMCLFQHVGKQDRTHARTSMVKIAWRKLFAGILCGCVVLLVAGGEVSDEKNNPNIHILTALFTTRTHKENKQVLPYQPTLGKLWPT